VRQDPTAKAEDVDICRRMASMHSATIRSHEPATVAIITWNVGGVTDGGGASKRAPRDSSLWRRLVDTLHSCIEVHASRAVGPDPGNHQVIAFCLQEVVDPKAYTTWIRSPESKGALKKGDHNEVVFWTGVIAAACEKFRQTHGTRYETFGSPAYLGGNLIVVAVRQDFMSHCQGFESAELAVDRFQIGLKGGVGVRLEMRHSSVCIVNVHLAALKSKLGGTKENEKAMRSRLKQLSKIRDGKSFVFHVRGGWQAPDAHQFFFICGDTNMRLGDARQQRFEQVAADIANGDHQRYVEEDQLLTAMQLNQVTGIREVAPITFPPTFKRCMKSPPDARAYNPKRIPAWTDRVLGSTRPGWKCLRYTSVDQADGPECLSDHDPVVAVVELALNDVDLDTLMAVLDTIPEINVFQSRGVRLSEARKSEWQDVEVWLSGRVLTRCKTDRVENVWYDTVVKRLNDGAAGRANFGKLKDALQGVTPQWLKSTRLGSVFNPAEGEAVSAETLNSYTRAGCARWVGDGVRQSVADNYLALVASTPEEHAAACSRIRSSLDRMLASVATEFAPEEPEAPPLEPGACGAWDSCDPGAAEESSEECKDEIGGAQERNAIPPTSYRASFAKQFDSTASPVSSLEKVCSFQV